MSTVPLRTLNDGTTLPAIGFGTYPMRGPDAVRGIASALDLGYRLLDTAVNYENEREVGAAIAASGLARADVQVTTKVPGRHHREAVASVEGSLERLRLDHLDLVLIHWPNPQVGHYLEAYEGLLAAREQGLVTSVGVSNFTEEHLRHVITATGVTPVVNQIEMHPLFPQAEMRQVHRELGIQTQSWSPLGKRQAQYQAPAVVAAAHRLDVSPAQVILRWQVQCDSIPLPKSADPDRQRSNLDIFGFELSSDEVEAISALGRPDGRLFDGDPRTHEEM